MKRMILIVMLMFQSALVHAGQKGEGHTFNRFWIGYIKEGVSTAKFLNDLNSKFFAETIRVGGGRGLVSYVPYITDMTSENGPQSIPDEIALVTYSDEASYRAIRETPEGKAYGELHWDYFDKTLSKSTLTEPFVGKIELDHAYELNPRFRSYQKAQIQVNFYRFDGNAESLTELAKKYGGLKSNEAVLNSVLLVKNGFAIEYRILREGEQSSISIVSGGNIKSSKLPRKTVQAKQPLIRLDQGANFQF